jgi:ABC-type nitrate/sulfonate/bicarbonate transport system ATPase subunit
MPAGLHQVVGETGWQLSQGERSRCSWLARFCRIAKMVILDESFAAPDPENLRQSMECTLKHAKNFISGGTPMSVIPEAIDLHERALFASARGSLAGRGGGRSASRRTVSRPKTGRTVRMSRMS